MIQAPPQALQTLGLVAPPLLVLLSVCLLAAGVATVLLLFHGAVRARHLRERGALHEASLLLKSELVPGVTVVAVPPDFSAESMRVVRQLPKLHYGRLEVMVVLDGPNAADVTAWEREFHLVRISRAASSALPTKTVKAVYASCEAIALTVAVKERGGEADCLNAAVNLAQSPVIGTVEWKAELPEEMLLRMIGPMIDDPENTPAVCASAPAGFGQPLFARVYRIAALRTWLCRSAGLSAGNAVLPAPGSTILWNRHALIQAGGFAPGPGCNIEMVMRLQLKAVALDLPHRIPLIPGVTSRPTVPQTPAEARARLSRDQREVAAALGRHWSIALGGRAIAGLFCSRLLLPLLETFTLVLAAVSLIAGWMPAGEIALLLTATILCQILISMTTVIMEPFAAGTTLPPRELTALFFAAVPENLGIRQWRNLRMISDFVQAFLAPSKEGSRP